MCECRKESIDAEKAMENTAGLPDGWKWNDYEDGSGSLRAPDGTSYFSYDRAPYANCGGIEYKREKGVAWDVYWGAMSDFKSYAEEFVNKFIVNNGQDKEDLSNVATKTKGKSR